MWLPNTPADKTAATDKIMLAPIACANGTTIGKAMMYIPQFVPMMNSVAVKIKYTINGSQAGDINGEAASMTDWVKRILSAP